MTYSDKLRHFPERDPKKPTGSEQGRQEIADQIRQYLDGGNAIEQVPFGETNTKDNGKIDLRKYRQHTGWSSKPRKDQ